MTEKLKKKKLSSFDKENLIKGRKSQKSTKIKIKYSQQTNIKFKFFCRKALLKKKSKCETVLKRKACHGKKW